MVLKYKYMENLFNLKPRGHYMMLFCIIVMLRRSCSLTPFLGSSTYWIFMLDAPSPKGDLCLFLVSNQRPFAR